MKLNLLLLLVVMGFSALVYAQKKPYDNLIITEAVMYHPHQNYVEFTNMGTETIDLSNFEFGHISPWDLPWTAALNHHFRLPKKMLAPGKSYLISTAYVFSPKMWKNTQNSILYSERITKPELLKMADQLLYFPEFGMTAKDTITPYFSTLDGYNGRECWFLRHHFINDAGVKDSVVVDQVGGVFDREGGLNYDYAYDVAGVTKATGSCVLIRKASVKTGNVNFNSARGLDLNDSEWVPVQNLSAYWYDAFWTAGNHAVGAVLDANTLVPKTENVAVDIVNGTITIPWGVRRNDSIMHLFVRKPGLAWHYDFAKATEDSAYISSRSGDILTLYVCGNITTIKKFVINVSAPTSSDNNVIPKNSFDFTKKVYSGAPLYSFGGWRVSDGVKDMDTISFIGFATRIDTLFRYLEKPPKATWKIKSKDGILKPDLRTGDILQVTSENGKIKEYYLKLLKKLNSANNNLSSITWPDMPSFFKGEIAKSYGWKGDTIPGFNTNNKSYIVKIPLEFDGIPALVYTKSQLNSKVVVNRAKSLAGSPAERTVSFTVTAENDTTNTIYTVRFEKEKDNSNIQPWKAEPFLSQIVYKESYAFPWIEIVNPGTEVLDLSRYMLICSTSGRVTAFNNFNSATTPYENGPWRKYVPGRKWQDKFDWVVQPRILVPDLAVNSILYPGECFTMTQNKGGGLLTGNIGSLELFGSKVNVNFATDKNPWGYIMPNDNALNNGSNANYYLYKILNDSVVNGLKSATDIDDFQLVDVFGSEDGKNWVVGGINTGQNHAYTRKPNIYKGNNLAKGSWGTNIDNSEWIMWNQKYWQSVGIGYPRYWYNLATGIGSHIMDDVTIYRSTVSSKSYKVSPSYSKKESIKGITAGTTVTGFYNNILKANELQTLKVKSATNGAELAEASLLSKGDTLVVLSADSTNISKYILDVTTGGLSSNAMLTSAKYTVTVTGSTGTISGIKQRELLKNVFDAVVVPAGASLTITDANDAYMSLTKLRYDTAYVSVIATDKVNFEVIAENGSTKILYQLTPTTNPSDAYITSDVYSVDQFASLIQFVPVGTSASILTSNITPAPGAKVGVFDKAGFARTTGEVYRDDKLVVTSADGNTTKAYYFSMLNYNDNKYFAYVISDDYLIDQVQYTITGSLTQSINAFKDKLYPSFGASLSIIGKDGKVNSTATFNKGDKLLVTAADGLTTATYNISVITKVIDVNSETIKMYPNPTDGRVIVQGLAKGNRVRVINAAGITLRDVIVDNSTDYVSLAAQPAGIYVFVISNGDQFINIQKIVKK